MLAGKEGECAGDGLSFGTKADLLLELPEGYLAFEFKLQIQSGKMMPDSG